MLSSEKIPERTLELAQETKERRSSPLGATLSLEGANFSVYSKHATAIELLLFDCVDDARPARVIRIDPSTNRTYHYSHVFVPRVKAGQIYGYRVEGPFDPPSGMRFDPAKVLLDPYGRGTVVPKNYSREAARNEGDNAAPAMKSVVVNPRSYDWEGDTPLNRPSSRTIVYGDVTDPAMMDALAISRACAVIVTTRDYSAVKRLTGNLLHFYPGGKVMTAVSYLFQRDELREIGAAQVVALMPEDTLSFGRSILGELGINPDSIEPIMNSLRAADYASIRGVGGNIPEDIPKDVEAGS
jgi:voltage-gated potassium channel Kch